MRRTLLPFGLVVTLALLGAACGDDDDDGGATATSAPAAAATTAGGTDTMADSGGSDTTEAATMPAGQATIEVGQSDEHGEIIVDAEGMSLYMFSPDTPTSSACSGNCLQAWPPLLVDGEPVAGEGIDGELTTLTRDDGSTQVVYNGHPLYYYAADEAPGDTNGQGVGDNWWLLTPDGEQIGG